MQVPSASQISEREIGAGGLEMNEPGGLDNISKVRTVKDNIYNYIELENF